MQFASSDVLINYFNQVGTLQYNASEIDLLSSYFMTTPRDMVFYELLQALSQFLRESESRWNEQRSDEQILQILNTFVNAIAKFKKEFSNKKFKDNAVFLAALNYCKTAIQQHVQGQNRFSHLYQTTDNDLKRMMESDTYLSF